MRETRTVVSWNAENSAAEVTPSTVSDIAGGVAQLLLGVHTENNPASDFSSSDSEVCGAGGVKLPLLNVESATDSRNFSNESGFDDVLFPNFNTVLTSVGNSSSSRGFKYNFEEFASSIVDTYSVTAGVTVPALDPETTIGVIESKVSWESGSGRAAGRNSADSSIHAERIDSLSIVGDAAQEATLVLLSHCTTGRPSLLTTPVYETPTPGQGRVSYVDVENDSDQRTRIPSSPCLHTVDRRPTPSNGALESSSELVTSPVADSYTSGVIRNSRLEPGILDSSIFNTSAGSGRTRTLISSSWSGQTGIDQICPDAQPNVVGMPLENLRVDAISAETVVSSTDTVQRCTEGVSSLELETNFAEIALQDPCVDHDVSLSVVRAERLHGKAYGYEEILSSLQLRHGLGGVLTSDQEVRIPPHRCQTGHVRRPVYAPGRYLGLDPKLYSIENVETGPIVVTSFAGTTSRRTSKHNCRTTAEFDRRTLHAETTSGGMQFLKVGADIHPQGLYRMDLSIVPATPSIPRGIKFVEAAVHEYPFLRANLEVSAGNVTPSTSNVATDESCPGAEVVPALTQRYNEIEGDRVAEESELPNRLPPSASANVIKSPSDVHTYGSKLEECSRADAGTESIGCLTYKVGASSTSSAGRPSPSAELLSWGNSSASAIANSDRFGRRTPLSLGLETGGGVMTVIIPRNTAVPVRKKQIVSTYVDNQTEILIHVYEGERLWVSDNSLLGSFELMGIAKAPRGQPQITVCFEIDATGILNVFIEGKKSIGQLMKGLAITNVSERPSRDKINKMIEDAEEYNAQDEDRRRRIELKDALENYVYKMRTVITDERIASLLEPQQTKQMMAAVQAVIDWLKTRNWLLYNHKQVGDFSDFDAERQELQDVCGPILEPLFRGWKSNVNSSL